MKNFIFLVGGFVFSSFGWSTPQGLSGKNPLLDFRPGRAEIRTPNSLTFENFTVTQKIGSESDESFEERVFFSDTYAQGPDSPVLFYLCGEWKCSGEEADFVLADRAKLIHAYVVAVEHRYYGASTPVIHSPSDYKNFTSEYALADFAAVERKLIDEKNLRGPWFSYGGSYGGTLAAYYRIAYPELTAGAFAFSPPLIISKYGLTGYESTAVAAFGPDLTIRVREATAYLLSLAESEIGKLNLQKLFSLPDLNFDAGDIGGILIEKVPEFAQNGGIKNLADALPPGMTSQQEGEALANVLRSSFGAQFWTESPYGLRHDPVGPVSRWIFQAFNEFGWLYVTNPNLSASILPIEISMDFYRDRDQATLADEPLMARSDFPKQMEELVKSSSTRIVIFNGTFDPWMASSLPDLQDPVREIRSVVMTGGSHCVGEVGTRSSDPTSVGYPAQVAFLEAIEAWSE